MHSLRLGTRGSLLATTQSQIVAANLARLAKEYYGYDLHQELIKITTKGDKDHSPFKSFQSTGSTGIFVNKLREALINNECDYIVHSLKDLPANDNYTGIELVAVPFREDPRDTLCSAINDLKLKTIPGNSTIGTASPRRRAQLNLHRPDLIVKNLRGNVDTRLSKLNTDYSAIILAAAGLKRINRTPFITEFLPLEDWPTAAGQGALGIECRAEDAETKQLLQLLNDKFTYITTYVERSVLKYLKADCSTAIGVSTIDDGTKIKFVTKLYEEASDEIKIKSADYTLTKTSLQELSVPQLNLISNEIANKINPSINHFPNLP